MFSLLGNFTTTDAHVDGAGGSCDCTDEVAIVQNLPHQFGEGVDLGRLKRLGLGDQVAVASGTRHSDQVDRDRGSTGAVIGRRELVDDCLHAVRRVLRRLSVLRGLGRDDVTNGYGHILFLNTASC